MPDYYAFSDITTSGVMTFTSNSQTFTVTTNYSARVGTGTTPDFESDHYAGTGWTGTAINCYFDNGWTSGASATFGTGGSSFNISSGTSFKLKSFWLFVTHDYSSYAFPTGGTITVTGKNGSTTVFTATRAPDGGWILVLQLTMGSIL